jgi:hypothetical protein
MTTPTQEQIDKLFFESGRLSTEHFIKLIWKQAQAEERKRINEIIKKNPKTIDVWIYQRELKAQINSEDKSK